MERFPREKRLGLGAILIGLAVLVCVYLFTGGSGGSGSTPMSGGGDVADIGGSMAEEVMSNIVMKGGGGEGIPEEIIETVMKGGGGAEEILAKVMRGGGSIGQSLFGDTRYFTSLTEEFQKLGFST
jgi:hypothetical protein